MPVFPEESVPKRFWEKTAKVYVTLSGIGLTTSKRFDL